MVTLAKIDFCVWSFENVQTWRVGYPVYVFWVQRVAAQLACDVANRGKLSRIVPFIVSLLSQA